MKNCIFIYFLVFVMVCHCRGSIFILQEFDDTECKMPSISTELALNECNVYGGAGSGCTVKIYAVDETTVSYLFYLDSYDCGLSIATVSPQYTPDWIGYGTVVAVASTDPINACVGQWDSGNYANWHARAYIACNNGNSWMIKTTNSIEILTPGHTNTSSSEDGKRSSLHDYRNFKITMLSLAASLAISMLLALVWSIYMKNTISKSQRPQSFPNH